MGERFKLADSGDRGWFIGPFDKAVFKTGLCEVALQSHKKGEKGGAHFHMAATETNLVVSGRVLYNNSEELGPGDGIIFYPNDICQTEYLEDTVLVVVKTPGVLDDKFIVS